MTPPPVPKTKLADIKIHVLRWGHDSAARKGEERTDTETLTNGYIEIDGWPMVGAQGANIDARSGEWVKVNVTFIARSVEFVHHDAESWHALTGVDYREDE